MQAIPALGFYGVGVQRFVAGYAPHVSGYAVFLSENILRLQCFAEDGAAAKELRLQLGLFVFAGAEFVHAAQNAVFHIAGHGRHGVRLVHQSDVVKNVFAVFVHAANAILNDDGDLVGERGIVSEQIGNGQREDVTVAVLVLQAFAGKRGAARGATEEEAACAHIRSGPDEIGDALETEHRVINKEWNGVDAVGGISGARGNERGHGAGFGDSLFKDLAVFGFLVVHQGVDVDRLVFLANAGINSGRSKERFHAKSARFVWNDRNYELADFGIAQHFSQHADIGHGGGDFPALAAIVKFFEEFIMVGGQGLRADAALRHVAAEGLAAGAEVLDFDAVFGRTIERHFDAVLIIQRNAETRTKYLQLFFVQLFLLVSDVLAFASFAKAVAFDGARENYRRA